MLCECFTYERVSLLDLHCVYYKKTATLDTNSQRSSTIMENVSMTLALTRTEMENIGDTSQGLTSLNSEYIHAVSSTILVVHTGYSKCMCFIYSGIINSHKLLLHSIWPQQSGFQLK